MKEGWVSPEERNFMDGSRWDQREFRRITTVHLERTFLSNLDNWTPQFLKIFLTKGGVAGTKIKHMLDSLSLQQVEGRRDVVIRCLVEFLGESAEELIKDYQDVTKDAIEEDIAQHVMKVLVINGGATQEDVLIVIEGKEILHDYESVAKAYLLLMGFIYAMNFSYPPKLKYTFEVFQKLFLQLDVLKMSPKVTVLHKKLVV
ncbi:hypothetical protein VZT92_005845 [Zoarces viviparus]|uniref:Uncharacterized protein n=1 Tax=Zoarces viviparus TaxID=48416 RepID=A0AAW1FN76_ZOAVI